MGRERVGERVGERESGRESWGERVGERVGEREWEREWGERDTEGEDCVCVREIESMREGESGDRK